MVDKSDSLNVDINTQTGERYIETVAIYVPLFRTGSPEDLLKFVITLNKIIRGQDLSIGPQQFVMTSNSVTGEAILVF